MKSTIEMTKQEIISEILKNNPNEKETHLRNLPMKILQSQLFNYRKYNPEWNATI